MHNDDCELNNGKISKPNALENLLFTSSVLVSLEMASRKKPTHLSDEDRSDIIERMKRGQLSADLAQIYNVARSTISKIRVKYRASLENSVDHSVSSYPPIDEDLYRCVPKKGKKNVPLSTQIVLREAQKTHSKCENSEFDGSLGWFAKFKALQRLENSTIQ